MPEDHEINDDKAPHVVPFILRLLSTHQKTHPDMPFFIGLNGVQGAGKTVLVSILQRTLQSAPYNLATVVFSLDDFYLTHADQQTLAKSNPDNPLLQHRGQPSTHDIDLALQVFESLKQNKPTKIPQYDKSAFSGQGDRVPESQWEEVNTDPVRPIRVVLFEGWCVGFRSLPPDHLEAKWQTAFRAATQSPEALLDPSPTTDTNEPTRPGAANTYQGRLGHNALPSVQTINTSLSTHYNSLTDQLDAFIHIDAQDPLYVYAWRQEQEHNMKAKRNRGMTDAQVKTFIDGYYPAYELYTDTLRDGVFKDLGEAGKGRQMRLVVGRDRKVREVIVT